MTTAIRIRDVHKYFGRLHVLRGIDLDIAQGEFFALLGPNGAGKTTLINALAGLVRVDRGKLSVMGCDVDADYRRTRRALGVVPQELVYDPFFTVRETLRFQSGYFGLRKNDAWIDELIAKLGLEDKADTDTRKLSGGMKRRVLVAQALVHRPPVIVLDEPTAGVDVTLRQSLWDFIRQLNRDGHTIVLTTHYLEEAETLCRRIAMMKQGRIVALDTTDNLLAAHGATRVRLKLAPAVLPAGLRPLLCTTGEDGFRLVLDSYRDLESVLATIREAGIALEAVEVTHPDLEDIFLQMMGGS